jgi:predicted ribosome quality control (RQC) complex YloA/Tae2 family protein
MKITALHTARLVAELRSSLKEAKVAKLHKSESDRKILIQLSGQRGGLTLAFHFAGKTPYLYLQQGHTAKIVTTNFLPQLMGGRITSVSQIGYDRIIRIDIAISEQDYSLIFELFGQNSNLLLLGNNGGIITSLRKSKNAGDIYQPPAPPDYINPLEFDPDKIAHDFGVTTNQPLKNLLIKHFAGVDEGIIAIIQDDLDLDLSADSNTLGYDRIRQVLDDLRRICQAFASTGPISYTIDPPAVLVRSKAGCEMADSLSDILFRFSRQISSTRKLKSARTEVLNLVKRAFKKETRKLEKLRLQWQKAEEHTDLQKAAELLSMNIHGLKTGMESVVMEDVYSEDSRKIKVELVRSYSPGKNIERLFAKAKKLRDKMPGIKEERKITTERLSMLRDLRLRIEAHESDDIPDDINAALAELGLIKPVSKRKRKAAEPERLPYKQYTTTLGETVLVGRSASDNDVLTFKIARKNDLWFHSQQTSGSHVILRRPDRKHQFQKASIMEAAGIAAFFSSAKNSENVPVIFTEVKHVRKLKKGRPGQVLADRTKSVLVAPRKP